MAPLLASPPVHVVVDTGHGFWPDAVQYAPLGTLVIAALAVGIAWRQFGLARKLREEQARPYVVASLDASDGWSSVSLAVQNLGTTVAKDVRLQIDPPPMQWRPKRSPSEDPTVEPLGVPQFPVMVPGQRWSTYWGHYHSRESNNLPTRYTVTVRSKDSSGRELPPLTYELDWKIPNGSPSDNAANRHLASIASSLSKGASQITKEDMNRRMRGVFGQRHPKTEVIYAPRDATDAGEDDSATE